MTIAAVSQAGDPLTAAPGTPAGWTSYDGAAAAPGCAPCASCCEEEEDACGCEEEEEADCCGEEEADEPWRLFGDVTLFPGPGAAGDYYEATVGLNWAPHANFTLRPELRWDWFSGAAPAGALPYDNGTDDSLFTYGLDGIVQF